MGGIPQVLRIPPSWAPTSPSSPASARRERAVLVRRFLLRESQMPHEFIQANRINPFERIRKAYSHCHTNPCKILLFCSAGLPRGVEDEGLRNPEPFPHLHLAYLSRHTRILPGQNLKTIPQVLRIPPFWTPTSPSSPAFGWTHPGLSVPAPSACCHQGRPSERHAWSFK